MSGSKITGPTLAIAGAVPAENNSAPIPTSFNANTGAMNTRSDYVSKLF
jgi:hypothetical protein